MHRLFCDESLEKGQVVVGQVTLEDGATLDVRAGVEPNTRVGHHAWLSALSWLPEGGVIHPIKCGTGCLLSRPERLQSLPCRPTLGGTLHR